MPGASSPLYAIVATRENSVELSFRLSQAGESLAREGETGLRIRANAQTFTQMMENIIEFKPNLVFLDESIINESARAAFAAQARELMYPRKGEQPVVFIALLHNMSLADSFKALGVAEVMEHPYTDASAMSVVRRAVMAYQGLVTAIERMGYAPPVSQSTLDAARSAVVVRQVIAVWSPKGGVGKTSLAINLAASFAYYGGRSVLLIDSDMNCGDIHSMLELDPSKNMYALSLLFKSNGNVMREEMLLGHTVNYRGMPLDVLIGAYRSILGAQSTLVGEQGKLFARALTDEVKRNTSYTFVVVDVGQKISEAMHETWLINADKLLIVCTSEKSTAQEVVDAVLTIRNSKDVPISLNKRAAIVFNRWDDRHFLEQSQILDATGLVSIGTVPYDHSGEMTAIANQGRIMVVERPDHPVSKGIIKIASTFDPSVQERWEMRVGIRPQQKKGALLGGLFKRG